MPVIWQKIKGFFGIRFPPNNNLDFHGKIMKLGNGLAGDLPKPMHGKVKILQNDAVAGGGHCLIYIGELQDRGRRRKQLVALKLLRAYIPEREKQMFRREVQAWCQFHHPNVIEFYGTCTLHTQLFMVSPWMQNGNLMKYLRKNPAADRKRIVLQVAQALVYLHDDVGVVHGDIKAENILISDEENALLADFGLSTRIEKLVGDIATPAYIRTLGSSRFTAPELIDEASPESEVFDAPQIMQLPSKTVKTDVYAFGMLILQTFSGKPPWQHVTRTLQVFRLVLEGSKPPRPQGDAVLRGLDDLHWSIAERCWSLHPDDRPLMNEIVCHLTHQARPSISDIKPEAPVVNRRTILPDLTDQIALERFPIVGGSLADIFRARIHGETIQMVAVKRFRSFHTGHASKRLERYLLMWKKLDHPHILPLYGTFTFGSEMGLVSPWMENGDCLQYLKRFPNASRLRLAKGGAQAVAYLHSLGLIHGRIRASNVLVSDDGHALLGDFSNTVLGDSERVVTGSSEVARTLRWVAPELLDEGAETPATDVYSFGMFMLEIWTGKPPFSALTTSAVLFHILGGGRPERPVEPSGLDDALWSLITSCWDSEPARRPSIDDVALGLSQSERA